jgi:diguanylate cyclase (GGDEF)-like protein
MYTKVKLSTVFKPRMFTLALITGLILALLMPITYFNLSIKEYRHEAQNEIRQLILQIQNMIIANPHARFFGYHQLLQILPSEQVAKIIRFKSYNHNGKLLQIIAVNKASRFIIREKAAIKLNNTVYGYLEIVKNADSIWSQTLTLFIFFITLGMIGGIVLYRFPLSIVLSAEQEINRSIKTLEHFSYWDALTGLPNRLNLNRRLPELIHESNQTGQRFALLFLDINRFKLINDNLGHTAGDFLLKSFAKRISGHLPDNVIFARVSGDEFVLAVSNSTPKKITAIYEKIVAALEIPFLLAEHELYITVSIGVSHYPDDAPNIDSLFKTADLAMYYCKSYSKNQLTFITPKITAEAKLRLTIEHGLRKSLQSGEIIPFFQPIVHAQTGIIIGFEALARWNHPVDGIISPNRFIPIAEETGLIVSLGYHIMQQACETLRYWHQLGFKLFVSVNLSANQFLQPTLLSQIDSIIKNTGINARYLQIEITESIAMGKEAEVIQTLKMLHDKGLRIAVDDFGTAYSSLGQLKNYTADVLKIDRCFIEKLPLDQKDIAITKFILNLAHSLDLIVVAEGVETAAQVDFLQQLNCDGLQGYYFSKPLTKSAALKLLKKTNQPGDQIKPGSTS